MKSVKKIAVVLSCIAVLAVSAPLFAAGRSEAAGAAPKELVICYLPNEASEEYAEYPYYRVYQLY
ncbi:MAG: hypothetical protein LBQ46_10365 [Treponema sp.]|jgi:hypothetical protein|nr:hypothetical protein [Treponema sp.]